MRPGISIRFAAGLALIAFVSILQGCGGGSTSPESTGTTATPAAKAEPAALSEADSEHAKEIFFDRCAGCHGTLRKGATGPNIEPARAKEIGAGGIELTLTKGRAGGMPPWGDEGILTPQEIKLMAAFLFQPAPEPPMRPLDQIKESWQLMVPVAQRPKAPQTKRDWQNYVGVILRDVGQVAIVDGTTKELAAIIETGFAVHILRSSSTGRYFYAIGRDGKVSMIDLWPEKPTLVSQVQGCYDARSIDASKYKGYEDKLVIEGCYWPPQYVVMDGQTLEPKAVVDITTPTYDTNEPLKENRVASIVVSHDGPYWIVSLKESGHVAIVDYSKPGFPVTAKIPTERFLHDGGWDHTGRYFMVAANQTRRLRRGPGEKPAARLEGCPGSGTTGGRLTVHKDAPQIPMGLARLSIGRRLDGQPPDLRVFQEGRQDREVLGAHRKRTHYSLRIR